MINDEPQVFQVEFNEIDGLLVIQTLNFEDFESMPFDGSMPASNVSEAEYRIMWTLNKCVNNLEEVKDKIKGSTDDKNVQAAIVLTVYQSCVSINPAIDMVMWNYMIRQPNLYHDLFDAEPYDLVDVSSIFKSTLDKMINPTNDMDDLLPDIAPPPWAPPLRRRKVSKKELEKGKEDTSVKFDSKKILTLENHMNKNLIGQPEVVHEVTKTLKRSIAGLKDKRRPLGVFLFAGASGVGKTHTAKLIQSHLFGKDSRIVRIDCSEYQQKHDAMKLVGSPNSYIGYEDGGQLTNAIKRSQNTVLLLDEAEKAHRDFWDMFLKVFDEGYLTDNHGENVSFEHTVIVMTSNLGNEKIAEQTFSSKTGFNVNIDSNYNSKDPPPRTYVERETIDAINKFFKPEFVNRLDEIVIFNYLSESDLEKVARLELDLVAQKINELELGFRWNKNAEKALAIKSLKAIAGAREMAKIRRKLIEDELAHRILFDDLPQHTTFILSAKKIRGEEDYDFVITQESPVPLETIAITRERDERNKAG